MNKTLIVAAIFALATSTSAMSAQTNTGCQGNCPGGDTVNTITNAGGQGGAGGHGGTGIGVGVGIGQGGSVKGSGNSHNANTNKNTNANANLNNNRNSNKNSNSNLNAQGQLQGQLQGQAQQATAKQGQSQSSHNDNRSSASNSNSNANSGNNSAQSVTVQGDTYEAARIPVSTAYAAGLTASNGVCMGSSSAGGQGVGFGISFGSTWNDENCNRRYNAQALVGIGQTGAAFALLCQDKTVAQAVTASGGNCPSAAPQKVAATQPARPATAQENATQYSGNDPIIRKRLGLPPLK